MYMICRHIKINGLRCQSPALKGAWFCYYHDKTHTVGADPYVRFGALQLPVPEDSAAIQLSVARINDALINDRIDLKKATSLYYGLQIAAQFIDRKQPFDEDKIVQFAEQTSVGDELAPSECIGATVDDCKDCPNADLCPHPMRGDENEVHPAESMPNARKPKAPASEINKVKKSRKMGCETVPRAEPAENQQATDKPAQPHRNCETVRSLDEQLVAGSHAEGSRGIYPPEKSPKLRAFRPGFTPSEARQSLQRPEGP